MIAAELRTRSFTLAGRRTSVALEPAFWDTIEIIAAQQGQSLAAFLAAAAGERPPRRDGGHVSLASTLRHRALDFYRSKAA